MDNEEMIKRINSVTLCLMAHPHNEPDSEFADRIDDLIKVKESLVENLGVLTSVSGTLFEFNEEIDRMMELYGVGRYTQAEELRDELAEKLDDIMRLGNNDR